MSTRIWSSGSASSLLPLLGFGAGVLLASLFDSRVFAGLVAVGLAATVALALRRLEVPGRLTVAAAAVGVMLFPLGTVYMGEGGLLPAGAAAFAGLGACSLAGPLQRGQVAGLATATTAVLGLGLTGSLLVLIVDLGDFLVPTLFGLVVVAQLAYRMLAASEAGERRSTSPLALRPALGTVVACQVAALPVRLWLVPKPALLSMLVLGAAVAAGVLLGRMAAGLAAESLPTVPASALGPADRWRMEAFGALLFAGGFFYYGIRLYLI